MKRFNMRFWVMWVVVAGGVGWAMAVALHDTSVGIAIGVAVGLASAVAQGSCKIGSR
jgi:hypothetical protein